MTLLLHPLEPRRLFAAGDVDVTFNAEGSFPGIAVDDVPGGNNVVADVAVTDLGGSVVVSTFTPRNGKPPRLMVHLFRSDGTLEPSFGDGGRVSLRIGARGTEARAVALDADGKILIAAAAITDPAGPQGDARRDDESEAGIPITTFRDWAIVRLNKNGKPDRTFSGDGVATFDVGSIRGDPDDITMSRLVRFARDEPFDIHPLANGSFLVHGLAPLIIGDGSTGGIVFENAEYAVVRFNQDGSVDETFGEQGRAVHNAGQDMAVAPDGSIYVAGGDITLFESSGSVNFTAIRRFDAEGNLDTNFGTDGLIGFRESSYSLAEDGAAVSTDSQGRLLAGKFGLFRVDSTGTFDSTFSDEGFAPSGLGGLVRDVIAQADGKIIVVGTKSIFLTVDRSKTYPVIARLNDDGTPDNTFGAADGRTLVNTGGKFQLAAAALGRDGAIYAAGTNNAGVSVIRYKGTAGIEPLMTRARDLPAGFAGSQLIRVEYRSETAINPLSIGRDDLHVTRPGGTTNLTSVFRTFTDSRGVFVAEYKYASSTFQNPDEIGRYTVRLTPQHVFDVNDVPAAGRILGTFDVVAVT